MTPPLKHGPPGSPQDWLAHAESDLNLARVAKEREDVLSEWVTVPGTRGTRNGLFEEPRPLLIFPAVVVESAIK